MKQSILSVVMLMFLLPVLFAQETPETGMPTIEADSFTRLEKRLMDAVVAQDRSAIEPMVAQDFELRTSRSGGELTLRDEWLQAATTTYKVRSFRISRLTVRSIGSHAVVNFFCEQQADFAGEDLSGNFFIVDLWQKTDKGWKLNARYSAGPGVAPKVDSNPESKE